MQKKTDAKKSTEYALRAILREMIEIYKLQALTAKWSW